MPSAANAAQREAKRLASLTFFLDHQIGRYVVADALRATGCGKSRTAAVRNFSGRGVFETDVSRGGLRLITRSNFAGCSTGSSAGLNPMRTLDSNCLITDTQLCRLSAPVKAFDF